MVNLIWYLTHVCEKEVCLSCAGLECVRLRESVVRTRALRAYRFLSVRVSAFAPYASLVSGLLQLSHGAKARGQFLCFVKLIELCFSSSPSIFFLSPMNDVIFCLIMRFLITIQVLGIPWDVDTDGLKEYMSKFGELEDCIVMKVGRHQIFIYVIVLFSFVLHNINAHFLCFLIDWSTIG